MFMVPTKCLGAERSYSSRSSLAGCITGDVWLIYCDGDVGHAWRARWQDEAVFVWSIALLMLVQLGFWSLLDNTYALLALLFFFFVAFNTLEAS